MQIEFSGYTLAPLQAQYAGHASSQETLITHVIKVGQMLNCCAACTRTNNAQDLLLKDCTKKEGVFCQMYYLWCVLF